jgi:hypothetical protein
VNDGRTIGQPATTGDWGDDKPDPDWRWPHRRARGRRSGTGEQAAHPGAHRATAGRFIAGALTSDVNPERLLGPAFEPLVSLSVAVILYDAGLGLDLRKLKGHVRKVVIRLIILGRGPAH